MTDETASGPFILRSWLGEAHRTGQTQEFERAAMLLPHDGKAVSVRTPKFLKSNPAEISKQAYLKGR
jgi:hypothetical protein